MKKKVLPLGIQDFEILRKENGIYVDKTEYIYKLIEPFQGFYFLSRPRRFGKTLLLSTLACLFEGKTELFKGLWISENKDYTWTRHPVLTIDFNGIDHETPEVLKKSIHETMDNIIEKWKIKVSASSIPVKLTELITALEKTTHARVVVLIDEYDKPIISHLGKGQEELTIATSNPFSILSVLKNQRFRNYWFETGTPTFLANIIREKNYPVADFEQLELRESAFTRYEIEDLSLTALLFQTGYLTIKSVKGRLFRLNYPNQEVKNSFIDYLYEKTVRTENESIKSRFTLLAGQLKNENIEEFIATVNSILASITYHQIAGQQEAYFHMVFYLMLSASGVEVLTEVLTSMGRIDIAVFFDDKIYIIELKCSQGAGEAIRQIMEKRYADRYKAEGKKIILMGINFDTGKREVTDWKLLPLNSSNQ